MSKKKYFIMLIALCIGVVISMHQKTDTSNILIDQNLESLAGLEVIDGTVYVVDEIPCSSSATETRVDHSYVNCTTCEKESGKETGNLDGKCTKVRPAKG